jgi:hypothetical protein
MDGGNERLTADWKLLRINLKKFRATQATEWLRPKWLGGFGYEIPTVK